VNDFQYKFDRNSAVSKPLIGLNRELPQKMEKGKSLSIARFSVFQVSESRVCAGWKCEILKF